MPDPNKKYNDSIRKVANKKFPTIFSSDLKQENYLTSTDEVATTKTKANMFAKNRYLKKNLKTKPKPGILDKIKNLVGI